MIVYINLHEKPKGEQNNCCSGQTKVRNSFYTGQMRYVRHKTFKKILSWNVRQALISRTKTACKRQQERGAQQPHSTQLLRETNWALRYFRQQDGKRTSICPAGSDQRGRRREQPFTNQACLWPAGLLIPTQAFVKSAACVARRPRLTSQRATRTHARSAPLRAQLLPSTCWDV